MDSDDEEEGGGVKNNPPSVGGQQHMHSTIPSHQSGRSALHTHTRTRTHMYAMCTLLVNAGRGKEESAAAPPSSITTEEADRREGVKLRRARAEVGTSRTHAHQAHVHMKPNN